jgi:hypothetical protein
MIKKRGDFIFGNKKAQGHVELILSFVIFVGFVFSIFVFLNPLKQPSMSFVSFETVQTKLVDNVTIAYQSIPLILNRSLSSSVTCFSVNNTLKATGNILAKSSDDLIIRASNSSSKLYLQNKLNEKFYTIYFSDSFNNYSIADTASCLALSEQNYSFGAPSYETLILFENLIFLDNSYVSNYPAVIENLGLENNFEFGISNLNRTILVNDTFLVHRLKSTNVLARDVLLKTINKNATQVDIFLNLRVW